MVSNVTLLESCASARFVPLHIGGSARTSLVVTCSPEPRHVTETVTTMRFGQRAMRVENAVKQQQVAEYRAAVKRQVAEVDRLTAALEDANAAAAGAVSSQHNHAP